MSRELKLQRATLISQARAMIELAETENRDLTAEEQTAYDAKMAEIDTLKARIDRADRLAALDAELTQPEPRKNSAPVSGAFNISKTGIGDTEAKALAHYVRTGDNGGLRQVTGVQNSDFMATSNDTDMNVGTQADGGYLVPTGHWQGIVAKRNESALFGPLGVTPYNGMRGTTANVPIETGGANAFVSTNEAPGTFDRDAPVFNVAAMTLVNFTKDIEITNDLSDMEDSAMMTFLTNYVGRALALTHNSALVTAALAGGTSNTLGAVAAATASDVTTLNYALAAEYADGAAWLMKRATEGKYRALTGNPFMFAPQGFALTGVNDPLWTAPVFYSSFVPAIGSGLKSLIFGNFEFMGMRETPLSFLYDPYSKASTGRKMLHYYTRIVYKVTNADAILYGTHPTA